MYEIAWTRLRLLVGKWWIMDLTPQLQCSCELWSYTARAMFGHATNNVGWNEKLMKADWYHIAVDSKFPPTSWAKPPDLLFPYTNNGAESYHSHLNAEFYVKHSNIYVFIDVLKKIQQTAYVSMNSMSQQARKSKYEQRKQRLWCLLRLLHTAYYKKEFLKKVCYLRTELWQFS